MEVWKLYKGSNNKILNEGSSSTLNSETDSGFMEHGAEMEVESSTALWEYAVVVRMRDGIIHQSSANAPYSVLPSNLQHLCDSMI